MVWKTEDSRALSLVRQAKSVLKRDQKKLMINYLKNINYLKLLHE